MRQRGAGARSIPTNFGFIFHAGPIQVSDTTAIEASLSPNTPPIAIAPTQTHHIPESSLPVKAPAPKRKRVVREEEDDQIWFKKRTKKTTVQEQEGHAILTATLDSGLDVTQQEPLTDKKPAKRKVVRKRVLVPRSRQKESLKPQPDQPIPLPEPVVEVLPTPNKKRTKTLAISKQIRRQSDTLEALPLEHGDEDKPSNHSIHTVSVTESAPPKKKDPSQDPQDVCIVEKSRKKTVPRKRVARKHVQESVETVQPSLEESTQTTTKVPLDEEDVDKKPKTETARQKRVAKKHPGKAVEQQTAEVTVDAQPDSTHETDPVPKKKKIVRRVRVPRTTTKRATSEQDESVKMVNKHDTKPSVSTDDIDSALLEAVAPAPVAKKPSKTPKRIFFNDDSDIDLDQMLSGIAAIAGTKGGTRTSTSRSSRVATRKTAA
ncbi:hypothetical protein KCU77_g12872, partial [Aureobasidium melanogenum]